MKLRKAFAGWGVIMVGLAMAGIAAGLRLIQSDTSQFGVGAIEDCETQGGTCYPNSWSCSGGTLRSWPCDQGYKCYVGGSCHSLTPTNTPVPTVRPTNTPFPTATRTPTPTPNLVYDAYGYHDGNFGTQTSSGGCTVFGWAVDPGNRLADVNVRVWSADTQSPYTRTLIVSSLSANQLRSDLATPTTCVDGRCGFSVNIYNLIPHGPYRDITVEVADLHIPPQFSPWIRLNLSPKRIQCLAPSPTPTRTPTPTPTRIPTPTPRPSVTLQEVTGDGIRGVTLYMYTTGGTTTLYNVYKCSGGCDPTIVRDPIIRISTSGGPKTYVDNNVLTNYVYKYAVKAVINNSTVWSNTVSATILPDND